MQPSPEHPPGLEPALAADIPPAAAAVRLSRRRRRNQICIAIIALGALNLVAYTALYAVLGGDAHNGEIRHIEQPDGSIQRAYYVRGHFLRTLKGREARVSRGLWIYSYLHSMSVFVTSAAMVLSMLVLARPHILATMRDGWISGPTFVAALSTLVILLSGAGVLIFLWDFLRELHAG